MAIVGTFGNTVFEVSDTRALGFETLEHSAEARINSQEIIGRRPVTEFLGPGEEDVSFTIRLSRELGINPDTEYQRLYSAMTQGMTNPLVLGGKPIGGPGVRWIIKSLTSSYQHFSRTGRTLWMDVAVSLKRYNAVGST